MSDVEPINSPYRFRHGDYCIDFDFDPMKEREPKRFVFLRKGWRSLCRRLYRVPAFVYYVGVTAIAAGAVWTAYYFEKQVYFFVAMAIALASVFVLRSFRTPGAYVGLFGLAVSALLFLAMLVGTYVPEVARTFAVAYVVARGGEVQVLVHPEWETVNRTMQVLAGRDLMIADVRTATGPLKAFPPQVVRDLHLPSNASIFLSPGDDELDWSEHVRAVSPKSTMLNGSLWNPATLQGLTRSGLKCELLVFDREFSDHELALLESPKLRYNTLRLHFMGPESLGKLAGLSEVGRSLGNLFLHGCRLDANSARVLAALNPDVILNQGRAEDGDPISLEQLDAIVASGLRVKKVFSEKITGEQAKRLARIPSLELLAGILSDAEAVDELSGSSLENIRVAFANEAIVASLMKYPKLSYVSFDLMEGSPDVILPLLRNTNLFGVIVRKYRGTADEVASAKRKAGMTILEFEVIAPTTE